MIYSNIKREPKTKRKQLLALATEEQKALLVKAAKDDNRTLSQFLITAGLKKAREVEDGGC